MRLPPVRIRVRLDDELASLYEGREPFLYSGGSAPNPLASVSVFVNDEGPHFHYVGSGLRERFGIELSFRLAVGASVAPSSAPVWPVRLLERFAQHAIRSRRRFESGHYLCLPEPLDPGREVRCGVLVPDPQLAPRVLQVVGLHEEELALISEDSWQGFLGALGAQAPLYVTVPGRRPLRGSRDCSR